MKILITGSAGFIGYHVTKKLFLNKNVTVVGIDNLNDYYEVKLKKEKLIPNLNFIKKILLI